MATTEDKDLEKALEVLRKANPYGGKLSQSSMSSIDYYVSTGSYALDAILSGKLVGGGLPNGRLTILSGESMTLKSSLVLKTLADAQKRGIRPVIFDTENAIDKESASRVGMDLDKCEHFPVFNIEDLRNQIHAFLMYVKDNKLEGKFIIAIDSLGNLQSALEQARIEKESKSADMGTRAKSLKSLLITCTQLSALTKTAIICTNHTYDDPSEMHPTLIKKVSGGKAVVYLGSILLQLRRTPVKADKVKQDVGVETAQQKSYAGVLITALTTKNRFVKQYLETELFISFNKGVDPYHGLLDIAVGLGVIEQNGATYTHNGVKLGYAKSFIEDGEFWKKLFPEMQKRIDVEWSYSTAQDEENKKLELSLEKAEDLE